MANPFIGIIRLYFPPTEWARASCVANAECDPASANYPTACMGDEGGINCGAGDRQARSFGIFKLLDVCWDPAMQSASPFTAEQWARVMEPNVNTWMASVIWSRYGWRAWTTCEDCVACAIPGGPIPYPRGPSNETISKGPGLLTILMASLAVGGVVYAGASRRQR